METIKFKDASRLILERKLGLKQLKILQDLENWMQSENFVLDDFDKKIIAELQEQLKYRVDDWNEQELIENFISPLFLLIRFNTEEYGLFSFRPMSAIIGEITLCGNPDAVIAKGRREPEIPYFCFNEYKKETDSSGEPIGQCLAAMIVAQEMNYNQKPIYGVVVKGMMWYFLVLQGKEYAISIGHKATSHEIFDIVKILKHLKTIIEQYVNG